MVRRLLLSLASCVCHITARGNVRQAIIRDGQDRARFVAIFAEKVEQYHVLCHALVLMTNHYHHLLLETPSPNPSFVLRHMNGMYTQTFLKMGSGLNIDVESTHPA